MINELIAQAEAEYGDELAIVLPELENKIDVLRTNGIKQFPDIRRANDGKVAGTINMGDVAVLYLLVRILKPKVIFEIGTWIGTSAMVMTEAMQKNNNDGHIYTCDANNYYALDDSYTDIITTINAYSDKALTQLPADTKIDFVFADGELNFATLKNLKKLLLRDAVIATHDYTLPAEKGVINYVRVQLSSFFNYHLYEAQKLTSKESENTLIGILAPSSLVKKLGLENKVKISIMAKTLRIGTKAFVKKIFKKLVKY